MTVWAKSRYRSCLQNEHLAVLDCVLNITFAAELLPDIRSDLQQRCDNIAAELRSIIMQLCVKAAVVAITVIGVDSYTILDYIVTCSVSDRNDGLAKDTLRICGEDNAGAVSVYHDLHNDIDVKIRAAYAAYAEVFGHAFAVGRRTA